MNFDKMLRCRGWIYHGVQCNVTSTNLEHCIRLPQTPCRRLVIFLAVQSAIALTHNAFQWAGLTPKIAPPRGESRPHLICGSLGPPISISIGSAVFGYVTNVLNRHTDTQTDTQTTLLRLCCYHSTATVRVQSVHLTNADSALASPPEAATVHIHHRHLLLCGS